jgi:hypothetical protein
VTSIESAKAAVLGWKPRGALFLSVVMAIGFVGWIAASVAETTPDPQSSGADSFSGSAIGHRALVEFLREIGRNVVVGRFQSAVVAGESGLLVLAEPAYGPATPTAPNRGPFGPEEDEEDEDAGAIDAGAPVVKLAKRTMVVLPKRRIVGSGIKGRRAELLPLDEVQKILDRYVDDASVVRSSTPLPCGDVLFSAPGGSQFVVRPPGFEVVYGDRTEALVVRRRHDDGEELWIVSDPDVVATHGLATAGVPAFVAALFAAAAPDGGGVVVDEAHHGFERRPSFFERFGRPPLSFLLLHAGLIFLLAFWGGAVRFGPPSNPEAEASCGRAGLVATTAGLLAVRAGGAAAAVSRHAEHRLRDAAARLRIDLALPIPELADRVDAAVKGRAKDGGFAAVAEALGRARRAASKSRMSADKETLAAAAALSDWRDSLHGTRRSPLAR